MPLDFDFDACPIPAFEFNLTPEAIVLWNQVETRQIKIREDLNKQLEEMVFGENNGFR